MFNLTENSEQQVKTCLDCDLMSPLFKLLTKSELKKVNDNRFAVNFRAGENIRKQGTFLSHVISLNAGLAKLYLEGINKRNIILRIIKPTKFIGGPGMYVDKRHHFTVTALVDSCACFIEVEVFKKIIQSNKEFGEGFNKELSTNTLSTFNRLINLTQKQMPGRLADVLIYLSDEIFLSRKFKLLLSKNDLAELSGMSKDNVGRVLNSFKNEGVIKIEDNTIEILKMDSLRVISRIG